LEESRNSPDVYIFARNILKDAEHIFARWHAFHDGYTDRQQFCNTSTLMRARMKRCCLKYQASSDAQVCTRAKRMLDMWPHLFIFLTHEEVELANNSAEQEVHSAVQLRKICFGNQSDVGERLTKRIS
jgi:hypothetical protein